MGFFDKFSSQFIDIIEWLDSSDNTISYRFERHKNEIKMGAKLTVRPGQVAVFVNEGKIADVFSPGMYELSTQNLPIISTLKGWKYGFNSPFKAEVYFFNTKVFTNFKWGTANPITIRDSELGPVRLRAFGNYSFRVNNPSKLLQELVSTDGLFQTDEISDHLRNMIMTSFASWVGEDQTPLFDLASHYRSLGEQVRQAIQRDFAQVGIELTQLLIENISLPPEVEKALDKRTSIGLLGNMQEYTQYQTAQAIEKSAQKPGTSNAGMELGMGMAIANQMMNGMQYQSSPQQQLPVTPPPPSQGKWYIYQNNQQLGPFSINQLSQQGLTPQTQVWKAGMNTWKAASEIPELTFLFPVAPPPPPSMEKQWYMYLNGERIGPLNQEQLSQQGLTRDTHVWTNGMEGWKKASEVTELASLLNSTPPPPPQLV
ncbi:MAG: SPFH domain-containing protein [Okeania sp. SIO2C9]|uniref:SPFH domain-containing protein n=1 Tax=Okeania sp. SIO2C9 TaxID=2607791 RepID=UPI0013BFC92F|nr:SPFH domain-containing protein [Okeania sp. SIO2C9]NEQ76200.1 SPFH domain-containing protein [Okeania sp. SIO2C9]